MAEDTPVDTDGPSTTGAAATLTPDNTDTADATGADAVAPRRRGAGRGGRVVALLALPLVVVALVAVLASLDLNGSSVALLSADGRADPNIVAGEPRSIRSDEYGLATPFQVGNVRKGFPTHTWIGLTDTELNATTLGAPTWSWADVFEPTTWPYFALDLEHAFALRWWALVAVAVLGVYLLLVTLRTRPALAATLAVVIGLSPLIAWWSGGPGPIVGFLAAATACLLLAVRARRVWPSVLLGLAAGYLACAAFFALYPPWLVSVGLVMMAVVLGDAVQRRARWWRVVLSAGSALVVLGTVVALWANQSADAIAALTGTFYPGNRVSDSGGGQASVLFGTALNPIIAAHPASLVPDPTLNQSEASSAWFPLPVLLLVCALVVGLLLRARSERRATAATPTEGVRDWATFLSVAAVTVLELLWMFVPLPPLIGRLTLLDRVPGIRDTLALGLCTVLLVYLAAGRLPVRRLLPLTAVVAVAAVATGALTWWAAAQLLDPGTPGVPLAAGTAVVMALCLSAVVLWGRAWPAMAVLVVVVALNYAIVNPLYRGLGPLTHGDLAATLTALAEQEGSTKWVDLVRDGSAGVIAASPQELLSGMTFYPSRDVWQRLAPTQETRWNNYAKYVWVQDPTAAPAVIEQLNGTVQRLRIDLCSPDVAFLDIRYVVTTRDAPPCFTPVTTVRDLGRTYLISRRS